MTNGEVHLSAEVFHFLLAELGAQGAADVEWSEAITAPANADDFAREVIFVICNSGMKNTVALRIFQRCMVALASDVDVQSVFHHSGKSAAISRVWKERSEMYHKFVKASDQLGFLEGLPWIGRITKYHLAKNFGLDVAKPDVHLQRLAAREGTTAQALCARIAAETGFRTATVDTVLWRACANGLLESPTGRIPSMAADHL